MRTYVPTYVHTYIQLCHAVSRPFVSRNRTSTSTTPLFQERNSFMRRSHEISKATENPETEARPYRSRKGTLKYHLTAPKNEPRVTMPDGK